MIKRLALISIICLFHIGSAKASQPIEKVSSVAWYGLTADERALLQERYLIEAVGAESFGTIIDNQGLDRSTPGTTGGAQLGGAIANATYIDKTLIGHDKYSATGHLAVIILGAVLGSSLDSKPQSQYQFRYTVRLANGTIAYHDQISKDPFYHPIGVCVSLPAMTLLPEQHLCTQTSESLRQSILLSVKNTKETKETKLTPITEKELPSVPAKPEDHINCKANNLPAVETTAAKCQAIKGEVIK